MRPTKTRGACFHVRGPETTVSILVAALIFTSLLGVAAVGAMTFNLHSSDAAGNGLALVYVLVGGAGLWSLLGLTLLVAHLKGAPGSPGAPWGRIAPVTLLVWLAWGGSQFAAIILLSDRRTPGVYQGVLQAAFLVAPLALLVHAGWRAFGLGFPAWAWSANGVRVGAWACAAAVLACSAAPWPGIALRERAKAPARALTSDSLSYPVLLLWDTKSVRIIESSGGLTTLPSGAVLHREGDPILIDALFRVYAMQNLRPRGGAMKLMVTGPGPVDVEFDLRLISKQAPTEEVRRRVLACRWLGADAERDGAIRERIAREETLDGMIRALRGEE